MFKKLMKSHAFRNRTSWLLAVVLIPPFLFFFHMAADKSGRGAAGTLFGRNVSWEKLQPQVEWESRMLRGQLGAQLPDEILTSLAVQQAWERLMLLQEAEHRHVTIDDHQLAAHIRQQAVFQQNGQFSPLLYDRLLAGVRLTRQAFESQTRDDLLIKTLADQVMAPAAVTDDDLKQAYIRAHEEARVSLLVIDPASVSARVEPELTEEAIRQAYEKNRDTWQIPEQLTLESFGRSAAEARAAVTVTEEAVQAFYDAHQDRFAKPDGAVPALAEIHAAVQEQYVDQQARAALNSLSVDVETGLEAKTAFEALAQAQGLTIRTLGPGTPESLAQQDGSGASLVEAAKTLQIGQVSGVLDTDQGVSVVRLAHRVPERQAAFEEVRDQVKAGLLASRAKEAALQEAGRVRTVLQEGLAAGKTVDDIAASLNLTAAHPAPFTHDHLLEEAGRAAAVNKAIFTTPAGGVTEPVATKTGTAVVAVVHERLSPDLAGLEKDREALREQVMQQHREALWQGFLEDVRGRAKLVSKLDPANLPH